MTNEVVKSIRRIVRDFPDDPLGLDDAEDRRNIPTSRGVGFINARGDVTGAGVEGDGSDDEDKPVTPAPPTDDASNNDTGGQGGQQGSGDPNDDPTKDGDGDPRLSGDVKAVKDAATTGTTWGDISGKIAGVQTCFNAHPLDDGVEFIPPPGWPNPENGPPPDDFQLGQQWEIQQASAIAVDVATKSLARLFAETFLVPAGYALLTDNPTSIAYRKASAPFFEPGIATYTWIIQACTPTEGSTSCPLTAEGAAPTTQPLDGCCQVTFVEADGVYRGQDNDPECSASQITGEVAPFVCSVTDPSECFRFERLASGGTKITPVDASNVIVPSSIIVETDASGKNIGFHDSALYNFIK